MALAVMGDLAAGIGAAVRAACLERRPGVRTVPVPAPANFAWGLPPFRFPLARFSWGCDPSLHTRLKAP
jgi:hypothetical protein